MYDLVYLFHWDVSWYGKLPGYLWQQSICCTFIFLSGMCWSLSRCAWKRAAITTFCGVMVTVTTILFVPQERIVFGILTFIGAAMFLMIPLSKLLVRIPPKIGIILSLAAFLLFRDVNTGMLWNFRLPVFLYQSGLMTFLGFPQSGFYSSDYFSILPWIFLYMAGYHFWQLIAGSSRLERKLPSGLSWLNWLGRHTLFIYMLHQPILMAIFTGVQTIWTYVM
jgi:uncharacterized membrane protein